MKLDKLLSDEVIDSCIDAWVNSMKCSILYRTRLSPSLKKLSRDEIRKQLNESSTKKDILEELTQTPVILIDCPTVIHEIFSALDENFYKGMH